MLLFTPYTRNTQETHKKSKMPAIIVEIPAAKFGRLATAAALDGMDITRWVKRKIQRAAADGTLARFAAARKAANMEAAADAPAPAVDAAADALTPEKQ